MSTLARHFRACLYGGTAFVALIVWPGRSDANPEGGTVSGGQALIAQSGNTVTITQHSNRAVIDWKGFDIAPGETTQFNQPDGGSIALNRVSGVAASQINGQLTANGNIVIVNPNGVVFGNNAKVDVNGLIATTADTDNTRFMTGTGPLVFDKPGNPNAAIVNNGTITARNAGLVGLVAPNVINNGVITANLGQATLASGDTATIDLYGDHLMEVAISGPVQSQLVANSGLIEADGGRIALTAAAGSQIVNSLITVSGELKAPAVAEQSGQIYIFAEGSNAVDGNVAANKGQKAGSSNVIVSGILDVSGDKAGEHGGNITVTGDNVALLAGTVIDASGSDGASGTTAGQAVSTPRTGAAGGNIEIGGDYLGQGTTPTALNLYVDPGALILNDALNTGDAGRSIFWSDNTTQFYGSVYARSLGGLAPDATTWNAMAGGNAGNGGFVETSGHLYLDAGGYVDLTASNGQRGTYFLDPANISIYGDFTPAFVSTDGSINLAGSLKLWLDASDAGSAELTYNSLGTTVSGSAGNTTITVGSNNGLQVGERLQLGNGNDTYAATVNDNAAGSGIYTITAINGTTVTLDAVLAASYSGAALYGGFVSQLNDKSGSGNTATQTNAASMPLWLSTGQNGNSVIQLSNNEYLNTPNLDMPTFTVFHSFNTGGGGSVGLYGSNGPGGWTEAITNNRQLLSDTGFSERDANATIPNYTGVILQQSYNGQVNFYLNGASDGTANYGFTPNSSGVSYTLGALPHFGIYATNTENELVVYNNSASFTGMPAADLVNQYLSAKWGTTLTPPGSGATEAQQAMASVQAGAAVDGYSAFTTGYLERLSQSADISLQAANNINLDLQSDTLALASGRNLSLTAGSITANSAGTIQTSGAGNISLVANNGDINFGSAITLYASGSGAVSLKATGNIIQTGGGITTQGGAITLDSNSATANNGAIALTNASVASNGGNITLGGGNGPITGMVLNTDGSVRTAANGYAYGNGSYVNGIYLGGTTIDAGSGAIVANGIAASTSTDNTGGVNNTGTIQAAGTISLTGFGGSSGTGNNNTGIYNSGLISDTGSGDVSLLGTGSGSGSNDPDGIIQYGTVQAVDGNIIAHGITTTNGGAFGIRSYGTAKATGMGNVYLIGESNNPYSYGLLGLGNLAQTNTGSIDITSIGAPFYTLALALGSNTGNINIRTDSLIFDGAIHTGGTVDLSPYTASTAVNVATGGGGLQITSDVLNNISAGSLVIGNAADMGTITLGDYAGWSAPTSFVTGNSGHIDIAGTEAATGSGSFTFSGATTLGGSVSTANQLITFNNPVTLNADSSLDSGSAAITFGSAVNGDYNLTANAGTFNFSQAFGNTTPLAVVQLTSAGALNLPSISANAIIAQTTGVNSDLTIMPGSVLAASGSGTAITLASAHDFYNNSSSGALVSPSGRWLIYSTNPADGSTGNLASDFHRFSCVYGGSCPALAGGNGLLYSYAPSLTATPAALPLALTYGDSIPNLTGYAYSLSGYLGNDATADSVTGVLTGSTTYVPGSDAGATYTIDYASGTLISALGYVVTTYAGNPNGISVDKAHLTVSADGGKSMVYGASTLPGLTDTITGFVDGQVLGNSGVTGMATLTTTATGYNGLAHSGSNVGMYDINIAAGSLSATNYDFTFVDAPNGLAVTPATLTVATGSYTRPYGQIVTYLETVRGYVNGDTTSILTGSLLPIDPTNTTTPAGTYTLTANVGSLGTTNNNYVFAPEDGTLTISPVPEVPASPIAPAVTAPPVPITGPQTTSPPTAPVTGFALPDTVLRVSQSAILNVGISNTPAEPEVNAYRSGNDSIFSALPGVASVGASPPGIAFLDISAAIMKELNGSSP